MRIVTGMVIGGTRSGKSEVAEGIFTDLIGGLSSKAVYIATGPPPATDGSWAERIAVHRERRPPNWSTVEVEDLDGLSSSLAAEEAPVIVDSLTILAVPSAASLYDTGSSPTTSPDTVSPGTMQSTTMQSTIMPSTSAPSTTMQPTTMQPATTSSIAEDHDLDLDKWSENLKKLERSLAERREAGLISIFVADEVGLSVHPPTWIGVEFQDRAGILNSTVAALCDAVWLVVAGWAMKMDRIGNPR